MPGWQLYIPFQELVLKPGCSLNAKLVMDEDRTIRQGRFELRLRLIIPCCVHSAFKLQVII